MLIIHMSMQTTSHSQPSGFAKYYPEQRISKVQNRVCTIIVYYTQEIHWASFIIYDSHHRQSRNKMEISSTVLYAKIAKGKKETIKVALIGIRYSKRYHSWGRVVEVSQICLNNCSHFVSIIRHIRQIWHSVTCNILIY